MKVKFFLKNKNAFTLVELVAATGILALIFVGLLFFVSKSYDSIQNGNVEKNISLISQLQDEITKINSTGYIFDKFLQSNYIIFKNPETNLYFVILFRDGKLGFDYGDFSNTGNLNNIDIYSKNFFEATSFSITPLNPNIFKIDFTTSLENEVFSLYL